ncbi:hypothetical protein MMU07_00225 [Aquiflexum sp. LQ15W]|uniref:hypothetical protein n=1 Tax=Cognataquiflexum nitidum TaxID=2922272 RepID=UPI001F13AF1B|nr:hypothetical protein [Cognataquiflexum nitidum]MCH6197985.1 hypothetical protein [Cognataquiflexum nitidum]
MKSSARFPILLIFIGIVCFFSCGTFETPKEEVNVFWKQSLSFPEGLTHAKEINGKLYAASKTRIYSEAGLFGINKYSYLSAFLPDNFLYRLPISDQLMATIKSDELILMPLGKPFEEDALVIKMKDLDPGFNDFKQIVSGYGDQIGIDPKGHVLVPYGAPKSPGVSKYTPNFLWLKTAVVDGKVEILEQKLIKEEFFDGWVSIYGFKVFENFMRVTISNKTFDFDHSGNMEVRFESYTKSVQVGNDIITFVGDGWETFPLKVYKSDLSGKNPELIGTYNSGQVSNEDRRRIGIFFDNISSIKDTIVLLEGESIFRLSMNDKTIKLFPLDNVGLIGTSITSISLLDNSTVFVTTGCEALGNNCSGGYYKPLDKFLTQK